MQPISIKLKGFKGFRAGLGLEEVFIDFTSLPTGLIAIVGGNGMGKTTLLDNCHPFRIMPYKLRDCKEWSTGSFSFYDQCYGRDALKEFVFEFGGTYYRSLIMIDAERRKQEAYLYVYAADGSWVPYNDATKDGKTGAYDQTIEELVGSPTLYFSSVFRSQDARKLSSYPRSEILSIVCELLQIDKTKEQGEKATKVASALGSMVDDLNRRKAPILTLIDSRDELAAEQTRSLSSISFQEATIIGLKADVVKIEQQIRELELSNAAQALTQKRVGELTQRRAELLKDIQTQEQTIAAGTADHNEEINQIDSSISKALTTLQGDTDALAVEVKQEEAAAEHELAEIAAKKQAAETLFARSAEIKQAVDQAINIEKELVSDRAQLEILKASSGTLNSSVTGLTATVSSIDNSIGQDMDACQQDTTSLAAAELQEKSGAESDLSEIASKKQAAANILARAAEIKQAAAAEKELTTQLSTDRPRLEELRSTAANLRVEIAGFASVENEITSAQSRLDDLRRLTSGLNGLDCHGDGTGTINKSCKLLASAVEAEQGIPAIEQEILVLQSKRVDAASCLDRLTAITEEGSALAAAVKSAEGGIEEARQLASMSAELTTAEDRIKELTGQESTLTTRLSHRLADIASKLQVTTSRSQSRQSELAAQKTDAATKLAEAQDQIIKNSESSEFFASQIIESEELLAETQATASLAAELAGASVRIAELGEQEGAITVRVQQRVTDISTRSAEITARAQVQQQTLTNQKSVAVAKWIAAQHQLEEKKATLEDECVALVEEIRKLEATLNGDVAKEIELLVESIATLQVSVSTEESLLKRLHADLGSINGQIAGLAKGEQEVAEMDAEIAKIEAEMINWKIIAKACSNDGIIALELDDAGPAIAKDTNELLHACYGPRFSVRLETQGTKADGGLKEIFDITVFDAERDEEKSIRDMSGGEVTYIEDALSRAFSFRTVDQANCTYDALYSDEKDGALDAERKHEFMAIKRRALELGKHTREFFITQSPDLYEKASARIVLENGKVSVVA